jgi:hypothetical protein
MDWADAEDIEISPSIGRGLDDYNDFRILPSDLRQRVPSNSLTISLASQIRIAVIGTLWSSRSSPRSTKRISPMSSAARGSPT